MMKSKSIGFLLTFFLLLSSAVMWADFTISLVNPDTLDISACEDQKVQILIQSDDGIDFSSLQLEINDSTYNITDTTSGIITFYEDTLTFDPPGLSTALFDEGIQTVTLHPLTDLVGGTSETYTWSFAVDLTFPLIENFTPFEVTVDSLSFNISFDVSDPVSEGISAGVDPSSITVEFVDHSEIPVLTIDSQDVNWLDPTFSVNFASLTSTYADGDVVSVRVTVCDLAGDPSEDSSCPPNCLTRTFTFTLGETDCYLEPNPITPNDDGYNDTAEFQFPDMRSTTNSTVYIYSQKSHLVREIDAPTDGNSWIFDGNDDDGKPLGQGTYIYIIKQDDEALCNGTITIIR